MSEQNVVVDIDVIRDSGSVTKDDCLAVSQSLQINTSHHDIINWLIVLKTLTKSYQFYILISVEYQFEHGRPGYINALRNTMTTLGKDESYASQLE